MMRSITSLIGGARKEPGSPSAEEAVSGNGALTARMEGRTTMRLRGFSAAIVGIGLLALPMLQASVVRAGEDDNIATMIENAKTPADHEAIAAYYDKQAAQAKKEAEIHRKMEKAYSVGGSAGGKGTPTPLPQHCATLVKYYDGLAQEYTTLAAAHRAMAKAAK